MKEFIAFRNEAENIVFFENFSTFLGGNIPLGLRHAENPTLHIRNIQLPLGHYISLLVLVLYALLPKKSRI